MYRSCIYIIKYNLILVLLYRSYIYMIKYNFNLVGKKRIADIFWFHDGSTFRFLDFRAYCKSLLLWGNAVVSTIATGISDQRWTRSQK